MLLPKLWPRPMANGYANRIAVFFVKTSLFWHILTEILYSQVFCIHLTLWHFYNSRFLRQVPQRASGGFGDGDSEFLRSRQRQSGGFLPQGGSPRILQVPPVWRVRVQYRFHCVITGSLGLGSLGGSPVLVNSGPLAGFKGAERSATIGSGIWWANFLLL